MKIWVASVVVSVGLSLRNTDADSSWALFQEGTYAPEDGESRYMSSSAMDQDGNIGMAYNLSSQNTAASIRYTGRYNGDELGQMTFPEGVYLGWYRMANKTPTGLETMHTLLWIQTVLPFGTPQSIFKGVNQWRTRIASFTLNNGFSEDIGVYNFDQPDER